MPTVTALASAFVTLDGAGSGMVTLGPQVYGVTWHIAKMVTSTTSVDPYNPRLHVYRNYVSPGTLLDGTYSANQDVNETDVDLLTAESLVFVYENGEPGAIGTIVLYGYEDRGR